MKAFINCMLLLRHLYLHQMLSEFPAAIVKYRTAKKENFLIYKQIRE